MVSPRVLCTAVPFGYGPASKIHSIGQALTAHSVSCVFAGGGLAAEFFEREGWEVVEIDCETTSGRASARTLASECDYALSCMDPGFVAAVAGSVPVGYVDSLSWMWNRELFADFPSLREVDHYFVQDVFGAADAARRHGIRNVVAVGGVVRLPGDGDGPTSLSTAIVHLGGAANTVLSAEETSYPVAVVDALAELTDALWSRFDEVLVVCGEQARAQLRSHLPVKTPFTVTVLPHDDFLRRARSAELFLTAPGLTTLLELCALEVAPVLLPAQNYSQVLILDALERSGYPGRLWRWETLVPGFRIPPDTAEDTAVRAVASAIETFFDRPANTHRLAMEVQAAADDATQRQSVRLFQQSIADTVGFDGASQIAAEVYHLAKAS